MATTRNILLPHIGRWLRQAAGISMLILFMMGIHAANASAAKRDEVKVEVRAEAPRSCFVGETVTLTVTLISDTPDIANVSLSSEPDYSAASAVVPGRVSGNPQEVEKRGKRSYRWTIARYFVTFDHPGKVKVGEARYIAYQPVRQVVDDLFWGPQTRVSYREIPAECKGVEINVKALPEKGRPENFSGAVGDFDIEGWFPPGQIYVGSEAVAVIEVTGFGSLKGVAVPDISKAFRNGCRLRGAESSDEISQRDGRLHSTLRLTCSFIPEDPDGEISEIPFCYFDTRTGQYRTVTTNILKWTEGDREPKRRLNPEETFDI